MSWKPRYWVCRRCKIVEHRRYKATIGRCPDCHDFMDKARVYPSDMMAVKHRQESRNWRLQREKEQRRERKHSKPRNSKDHVLTISRRCRRRWYELGRARQFRSFQRVAEQWLLELHKCLHNEGINGKSSPPKLEIIDTMSKYTLGRYECALFEGKYHIYLNKSRKLPEMRDTLLHEAMHWIDDDSNIPNTLFHGHNWLWSKRLQKFKEDMELPVKGRISWKDPE